MAATATVAFGRYLRMLRERSGLSLEDVVTRAKALPEPIGKGYLSRCENGRQKLAFAKMVTLSRILEVPPEVLVERMELDLELDRIGGPDTEGLEFGELQEKGIEAAKEGRFWNAYAFFRDAPPLASTNELNKFDSVKRLSIITEKLGKPTVTFYELTYLDSVEIENDEKRLDLSYMLALGNQARGDWDTAWRIADRAMTLAQMVSTPRALALAISLRACLYQRSGDHSQAIELFRDASAHFREADLHHEVILCLTNMAQSYFDQGHFSGAKRALLSAERLANTHRLDRFRALIRILLGEIADKESRPQEAVKYWRDAIDIAKKLKDNLTWFRAEIQLFKHAIERGDDSLADSMERLIRKRANWVSPESTDMQQLKELLEVRTGQVSAPQHG